MQRRQTGHFFAMLRLLIGSPHGITAGGGLFIAGSQGCGIDKVFSFALLDAQAVK